MLGYITAEKPELKVWEYETYKGYYCGVCKSIGRRFGQLPRMALSYDAAFLSLLLASLFPEEDDILMERCLIHPFKKNVVIRNKSIDYAADVMLILTWYKLKDDIHDEGKLYAKAAVKAMKGNFKRLEKKHADLCRRIEENLTQLAILEEAKCDSLDAAAEAFAKIMGAIFEEGLPSENLKEKQVMGRIGYHLGKWVYLMDALDDIEENIISGAYNPLLYRFRYQAGEEGFKARIMDVCRFNLFHYLGEVGHAADLLTIQKNKGIIENIIYMGLHRRTDALTKDKEE